MKFFELFFLLSLLQFSFADEANYWYPTFTDEQVITVEDFGGVKLLGTTNGIYKGEYRTAGYYTQFLQSEPWTPVGYWFFSPIKSTIETQEIEAKLTNCFSIALQDSVRVWAVTQAGLFYMDVNYWRPGIPEQQWIEVTTLPKPILTVVPYQKTVIVNANGQLYLYESNNTWTKLVIPGYAVVQDSLVIEPTLGRQVSRVKTYNNTIYAVTTSDSWLYEMKTSLDTQSFTTMNDMFRSIDGGKSWQQIVWYEPFITDVVQYYESFDDNFPDIAFSSYDKEMQQTRIRFIKDIGIYKDLLVPELLLEDTLKGLIHSLGVSYVSKSEIPFFIAAGTSGFYTSEKYPEFTHEEVLEYPVFSGSIDKYEKENLLVALKGSLMMYGPVDVQVQTLPQKSDFSEQRYITMEDYRIVIRGYTSGVVSLYTISGRLLLREGFHDEMYTVDVGTLSEGLYILDVKGQDYRVINRFEK